MSVANIGKIFSKFGEKKISEGSSSALTEKPKGSQASKVRLQAGRISNQERTSILHKIGQEAERRYQRNLMSTGYNGGIFLDSFNFAVDYASFDNYYWLDAGSRRANELLKYLEYGTGLYGPFKKIIESKKISPKTGKKLLLKFKTEESFIYIRSVRGVKPGYMFTKAVESVRNERASLQRTYRIQTAVGI